MDIWEERQSGGSISQALSLKCDGDCGTRTSAISASMAIPAKNSECGTLSHSPPIRPASQKPSAVAPYQAQPATTAGRRSEPQHQRGTERADQQFTH